MLSNKQTTRKTTEFGNNPFVSLANGTLKFVFDDVSFGQNSFAANVQHVYSNKPNVSDFLHNQGWTKGWKLNWQQYLVKQSDSEYKYLDANGETHTFVLFDNATIKRYYDKLDATITMSSDVDENHIFDLDGTKLSFDKTTSCLTKLTTHDGIVYTLTWNDYLLTAIKRNGKTIFSFEYDGNMVKRVKSVVQNIGVSYSYDASDRLVSVYRESYSSDSSTFAQKLLYVFEYNSDGVCRITDMEHTQNYVVAYSGGKVKRITTQSVEDIVFDLGINDAAHNRLSLGAKNSCLLSDPKVVDDYYVTFNYYSSASEKYTDVTDKYNVVLRYFLNNSGQVVSMFEKTSYGLKTVRQPGAYKIDTTGSGGYDQINNHANTIASSLSKSFSLSSFAEALSGKNQRYELGLWVKSSKVYDRLIAVAEISGVAVAQSLNVELEGDASGAWQQLNIPFTVAADSSGELPVSGTVTVKISFSNGSSTVYDNFTFSTIGVYPSTYSELLFSTEDSAKPFVGYSEITRVQTAEGNVTGTCYFTEEDLLQTFGNKFFNSYQHNGNTCFDAVCNSGKRRVEDVSALNYTVAGKTYRSGNSTVPYKLCINSQSADVVLISTYAFDSDRISVTTEAQRGSVTSKTIQIVDRYGTVLSETDEYGVQTTYSRKNGLLTEKCVKNGNSVLFTEKYTYDSDGNLTCCDNGTIAKQVTYNQYGNAFKIENKSSGTGETNSFRKYFYDIFQRNPIRFADCTDVATAEEEQCELSYFNEKLDGVSTPNSDKIHIARNPIKKYCDYSTSGLLIKRVERLNSSDGQTTRREIYFNSGNVEKEHLDTISDKYGNVQQIKQKTQNGTEQVLAKYTYKQDDAGGFAAYLSRREDVANKTIVDYKVNGLNKLTGWDETHSDDPKANFSVRQIFDNTTKFQLGNSDVYMSQIVYDAAALMKPRIAQTNVLTNGTNTTFSVATTNYAYDSFGRIAKEGVCGYTYDKAGNVASEDFLPDGTTYLVNGYLPLKGAEYKLDYKHNPANLPTQAALTYKYFDDNNQIHSASNSRTYTYDGFGRITYEYNQNLGQYRSFAYRNGRLHSITTNGDYKTVGYSNGIIASIGNTLFGSDNYGNRTVKKDGPNNVLETYSYGMGNKLVSVKKANGTEVKYIYNADGVRCGKETVSASGNTLSSCRYFLDGGRLVGELRDGKYFYYGYNATGLCLLDSDKRQYVYHRDAYGNVVLITDGNGQPLARYEYDSWGKCTVYNYLNKIDDDPKSIGNVNPFRWKGYYFDADTGFYYVNGRTYDPDTGCYLEAVPTENFASGLLSVFGLDRCGLMCNNTFEFASSPYTVFTVVELSTDWLYDGEQYGVPQWLCWTMGAVFIVINVVITVVTSGATAGTTVAVIGGIVSAVVGASLGAIEAGVVKKNGKVEWSWDRAAQGFLQESFENMLSAATSLVKSTAAQGILNAVIEVGKDLANGVPSNVGEVVAMLLNAGMAFAKPYMQDYMMGLGLSIAMLILIKMLQFAIDQLSAY